MNAAHRPGLHTDHGLVWEWLYVAWTAFPILHPSIVLHAHWLAGVGTGAHRVGVFCRDHRILIHLARMGFFRGNKPRAHPDGLGTKCQRGCKTAPIVNAPCSNHRNGHPLHCLGNQRQRANKAGMPTALRALANHTITARSLRLFRMANGPADNHRLQSRRMELFDNGRGYAKPCDKGGCAFGDDDVDRSFKATWNSGEQIDAKGSVSQRADFAHFFTDFIGRTPGHAEATVPPGF